MIKIFSNTTTSFAKRGFTKLNALRGCECKFLRSKTRLETFNWIKRTCNLTHTSRRRRIFRQTSTRYIRRCMWRRTRKKGWDYPQNGNSSLYQRLHTRGCHLKDINRIRHHSRQKQTDFNKNIVPTDGCLWGSLRSITLHSSPKK